MRILHVIASTSPEAGGPIEGIKQRGAVLQEMGHQIEIACCDDPESAWLTDIPFPVHALGPRQGGYAFTPYLKPWLKEHAPGFDGVVVNGIWQYHALAARQAMRSLGKPYVLFTHGMLDPWFKRKYPLKHLKKWAYWMGAEYWNVKRAAAVLFTTEEERILARQSFWLYSARERVVNYGTRGPSEDQKEAKKLFEANYPELAGKRFLLFLSRVHPKKGCDLLIEAFASCVGSEPELYLVVAGPDQVGWVAELKETADRLGIAERVYWPGMLSGAIKWGAYSACEAFILPSHQENFGIVVAEALACNKPVLISNKVNIWREIEADGAGFVADDTLAGTRDLIERWESTSATERDRLRAAALECFTKHFEIRQSALSLIEALEGTKPRGSCPQ